MRAPTDPPFRIRLDALVASEARLAVVLRRGPKRLFQLIAWDLADDAVVPGQWMRGHIRLCDLSPSGERLLYWAHQYHPSAVRRRAEGDTHGGSYDPLAAPAPPPARRRKTPRYQRAGGASAGARPLGPAWTALSRPPYFTALAFWPSLGHWTGGGVFLGEEAVALAESADGLVPRGASPPPPSFRITRIGTAPPTPSALVPSRDGATEEARAAAERLGAPADWTLRDPGAPDLLAASGGRLFRLPLVADGLGAPHLVADFRDVGFAPLAPPPSARRW